MEITTVSSRIQFDYNWDYITIHKTYDQYNIISNGLYDAI